jgi:uncharacterized protein YjbI with pentapeptide repeats
VLKNLEDSKFRGWSEWSDRKTGWLSRAIYFTIVDVKPFERQIMDVSELYERYAAGERDFPGVDLSNANLNIAGLEDYEPGKNDLSGINLSGANLSGAIIDYVNLSGANLRSADLTRSHLFDTKLIGADLSDSILDFAEIAADLIDANLRESSLEHTTFISADLTGADFTGAYFLASGQGDVIFYNTILPDGRINNGGPW